MFLLLLILLSAFTAWSQSSNVEDIVAAVHQHFHFPCLYLLQESKYGYKHILINLNLLRTLASKMYIQSQLLEDNSLSTLSCNRPLFVMDTLESLNTSSWLLKNYIPSATYLLFLSSDTSLEQFFNNSNVPFNCEMLVAQLTDDHVVILTEVYSVSDALPLHTYWFGNWTYRDGLTTSASSFYRRRNNMHGFVLKTTIRNEFLTKESDLKGRHRNYFFSEVWITLSKYMNFTPEYKICNGEGNGILLENGTWVGIMGILQKGIAHATAEGLSITKSRQHIVDFIAPLWIEKKFPFIRASNIFESSWKNFLQPFHIYLWMTLVIIVFLLSFSFWIISCNSNFLRDGNMDRSNAHTFCESLFHIYSSMLNQGHVAFHQSLPSKILSIALYSTSVTIIAGYSAFFVSFLTLRSTIIPFSNFQELLEDGSYQLGILRHSSLIMYFQNAREPVLKELYMKIIAPNKDSLPTSAFEALQLVCNKSKYAHLYTLDGIDKYTSNLSCQLTLAPGARIETMKSMAVVKFSPYLGLFKHMTYKIQESGIKRQLLLRAATKLPEIHTPSLSVDFETVLPVLYILLVGITASFIIVILEKAIYKRKKVYISLNVK